ncbi:MAG: zinc-dependent alcohol dehydrogenase family protein [Anaerolineales bacterium]|nr:zinc-dependent alcohol dehydrogenase family protein [Anaerolineales bacterium]
MHAYRLFAQDLIENIPLRATEMPIPEPGPGQARIRVKVCGVCHTDLHTVEGDIHPPQLPITPGHQVVGIVDALAQPSSHGIKIGTRVGIPWLHSACGECEYCQRGLENLCPNAKFTGFNVDGGYGEMMLADTRYLLTIPERISDEQAAPLLCAGVVGYRALKRAEIEPGERVGLYGFGASAHLMIQVLNYWGCEVAVYTRSAGHQDHARELGAAWAGEAGQNPGMVLDKAVVFAPSGDIAIRALEAVRPGGTVSINAIHMSDIPSFPYATLWGERTLRSVTNATYQDGVEFLALAEQVGLKSTVENYTIENVNRALEDMKYSRFNGEAVLHLK